MSEDAGLLDETLAVAHPSAVALALVAAGVYQWTPAKHWYLDNCREPLAVLLTHWHRGARGALRMGMADARYGMGCCWLLLAVMLPAGVPNLPVTGGLAALILAEKNVTRRTHIRLRHGPRAGGLGHYLVVSLTVFVQRPYAKMSRITYTLSRNSRHGWTQQMGQHQA